MIEKTAILDYLHTSAAHPVSVKELLKRLHVNSDDRHRVKRLVQELILNGELIETRKGKIALPEQVGVIVGTVQAHQDGFAFVLPSQKQGADLYIAPNNLGGAFHDDLVIAQVTRSRKGKADEGKIVQILQRGQTRIIGRYQEKGRHGEVIPEDPHIPYTLLIEETRAHQARHGQFVVAAIVRYHPRTHRPEGEIVDILGFPNTPGLDEKIVIHTFNLPTDFPSAVLDAANTLPDQIPPEEIAQRRDLREWLTFTIDGENARDFDDAVSIERLDNGHYSLGVHIADVGFYVPVDSPLDQEAFRRGTSVYFPDRAIPMFPERLSSNICCLRERQDRLTLSVVMEFDPTGKMVQYDLFPSVIHSHARLTYTGVRQMLKDRDEALRERYQDVLPSLELMKDLSELLLTQRAQRGSLDFDLPEPELVLDMQGRIENIIKAERNLAHRMIEEFMIAANETVAAHLAWMELPLIYRVHEAPGKERIETLNTFLRTLGLQLQRSKKLRSKDIQRLLNRIQGKPVEHLVNILTLRSMKQARYAVKNCGHFGLASTHYTHFTSPIRRYPDLMVHRILRDAWDGRGFNGPVLDRRRHRLQKIAEHSSMRERVAVDAEREIMQIKKLQFMRDKLGDVFEGVISGVTSFGMFVELRDYFVEGLIHVNTLYDDHYHYREETFSLVGERSGRSYRVGDVVTVQVANVNVGKRQMDLVLSAEKP